MTEEYVGQLVIKDKQKKGVYTQKEIVAYLQ